MASVQDTANRAKEALRSATGHHSTSMGEQASKVVQDVRELGNIALENAGEVYEHAKERGKHYVDEARELPKSARHELEAYVVQHPLKSVLIAAGVGAFIGWLRGRD